MGWWRANRFVPSVVSAYGAKGLPASMMVRATSGGNAGDEEGQNAERSDRGAGHGVEKRLFQAD